MNQITKYNSQAMHVESEDQAQQRVEDEKKENAQSNPLLLYKPSCFLIYFSESR